MRFMSEFDVLQCVVIYDRQYRRRHWIFVWPDSLFLTKCLVLTDSKFDGADFTNGIVDRASFKGSSLRGAIFTNAVLTGTSFDGADVEGADFSEAYIGEYDIRSLCRNPTLKGENPKTGMETKISAGCN